MSASDSATRFRFYARIAAAVVVAGAMVHLLVGVRPDPPAPLNAPPPAPPSVPPPDSASTVSRVAPVGPVDRRSLTMPVQGVDPEDLVDTFNEARSGGRRHDAIDILAPRGTPVVAAADGRVVRLFESQFGGLTIYQIAADDRTVFYYAHLDGYAEGLAAGRDVRAGEVIGYVGDTGNAVPGNTHLHFAVWEIDDPADFWDGEPINPYPLLRGTP